MDSGAITDLVDQAAIGAYDRASVERFAAAAREEKERLQDALRVAQDRKERAEAALFTGSIQERLDGMVRAARRALAAERAAVETDVEGLLAEAELEAADIVAAARAEVERHAAAAAEEPASQTTVVNFDGLDIPRFGRHFGFEGDAR